MPVAGGENGLRQASTQGAHAARPNGPNIVFPCTKINSTLLMHVPAGPIDRTSGSGVLGARTEPAPARWAQSHKSGQHRPPRDQLRGSRTPFRADKAVPHALRNNTDFIANREHRRDVRPIDLREESSPWVRIIRSIPRCHALGWHRGGGLAIRRRTAAPRSRRSSIRRRPATRPPRTMPC